MSWLENMSKKHLDLNKTFQELPIFGQQEKLIHPLIETHCHLDMIKGEEIATIIQSCQAIGVEKLITIATSIANFETVRNFSKELSEVYFSLGTHPHQAKDFEPQHLKELRKEKGNPKFVAVGEIGLDFHYNFSPPEKQIDVFKQHLEVAIELEMPVIIHTREADEEMSQLLIEYGPQMQRKGVVHSFSSGEKLAKDAINQGFYLGFNGISTFKNAENVRSVIELTPIDKILIETDAPFLTPTPFRGRENTPLYLPLVAQKIVELKSMGPLDALQQFYQNSQSCFTLS